jgi:hypothetical protein
MSNRDPLDQIRSLLKAQGPDKAIESIEGLWKSSSIDDRTRIILSIFVFQSTGEFEKILKFIDDTDFENINKLEYLYHKSLSLAAVGDNKLAIQSSSDLFRHGKTIGVDFFSNTALALIAYCKFSLGEKFEANIYINKLPQGFVLFFGNKSVRMEDLQ